MLTSLDAPAPCESVGECKECKSTISIFIMAEGEIDNLTMEQYLALTRGNQAPGVELMEDAFFRNKNENSHEHVERVLDIVSLFNNPGVSYDAIMLCVFPITLTRAAKRWTAKQLEEIRNFKQEGDETLYQAWNKLQENDEINTQNQAAFLKNLETQIKQLTKEFHTKAANEINSPTLDQCKAVYADKKTSLDNGRHEISIASNKCTQIVQTNDVSPKILPCQLPPKELNPRNFTLPCTIGSLNFYALADLGASVNVIPMSIFEHLKLAGLKKTNMVVEMTDMTKRSPIEIVENILVKIDKFVFLSDFVVMNMLNTRNETMILGRPFLATIYAEIDVFNKEISLGIGSDRVTFKMYKKIHNFTTSIREIYMINLTSNTPSDASSRVEKTNDVHNKNNFCNQEQGRRR
ncbi:reverse transcriptase domain-containing protein [Tanacetum coccineum]